MDLGEPLDRALLERSLTVLETGGGVLAGGGRVSPDQRRWSFVPEEPWRPGSYTLRVDSRLEDLAGNNLLRLFDEKTPSGREPRREGSPFRDLSFVVAPGGQSPPVKPTGQVMPVPPRPQ